VVRSDACGAAITPPFAAGHSVGGYVVKATLPHVHAAAFPLVDRGA
jgi:hypothetical protein